LKTPSQNIEKSSGQSEDVSTRPNWIIMLSILWIDRKFIGIVTGSITILTAIIAFFVLTEYFKSTAVILPDADKSKFSSLGGGISDLAAMAGISVGGEGSIAKLYPTILKSESVLKNVIYSKYKTKKYADSIDLIHYWQIKDKSPEREYEVALSELRNALEVAIDIKLNVVSLSIETEDPQLSADILNKVIFMLDKFIRTQRNSNASEQRKWIEVRLSEVKEDLSNAENKLKEFREKNRMVIGSPQLLLEQERYMREVQINATMYVELKKQFELVKIEEIRTTPIISVMDYARPAAKKERPKKGNIILLSFIISIIGSGCYCIVEKLYWHNVTTWYKSIQALK
jgi:uncharacterized protein involved in exopolysaccharide biosynthesis